MQTREGDGVEVRPGPDPVVSGVASDGHDRLVARPASEAPGPVAPHRPVARWLVAGLTLSLATLGLALWAGGDDVATRPSGPVAGAPAAPAPLSMSAELPADVVAGEAVTVTVRWTDGAGIFSGSSEEWGDGVGTSSLRQGRCEPGAAAPDPSAGTYEIAHTWNEPGVYTVVVGVATYSCEGGAAVEEQVSETLTVEILPAR